VSAVAVISPLPVLVSTASVLSEEPDELSAVNDRTVAVALSSWPAVVFKVVTAVDETVDDGEPSDFDDFGCVSAVFDDGCCVLDGGVGVDELGGVGSVASPVTVEVSESTWVCSVPPRTDSALDSSSPDFVDLPVVAALPVVSLPVELEPVPMAVVVTPAAPEPPM